MNKKVLFRADGSSEIGLGHIKRSLVYAKRLNNHEIHFASKELTKGIKKEIPYPTHTLNSSDIDELIELCHKLNIEHLIIDNYKISYEQEHKIKKNCDLKLSVFDDTYEKHYCDEVINHNIGASAAKYHNKLPRFTKISIIEPLIRDEFKNVKYKNTKIKNYDNFNIFICMGGVDSANLTPKILDALKIFKNINIHIITTSANKNIAKLQQKVAKTTNVKLHIDTTKMAELMSESDLAIITPSVIAHEVLYMELPFIAIQTEPNQSDIRNYLDENGYGTLQQFNTTRLQKMIEKELY